MYITRTCRQSNVMIDNYTYPQLVRTFTNSSPKASPTNTFEFHHMPMPIAICQKRYDIIQEKLAHQPNGEDPNEEILFQNVYMTGLEFSIYKHDWRMAIVFYIHAADPKYNCFDGRVVDNMNRVPAQNMYHICENNGLPIAGFKGLYCLLNPKFGSEYNGTLSALWLMEKCYIRKEVRRRIDSMDDINCARGCMHQIGAGCVWNKEFCQRVYTILQSLRKVASNQHGDGEGSLPDEICLHILDYVVDDILSFTIWKGLMHVSTSCSAAAQARI